MKYFIKITFVFLFSLLSNLSLANSGDYPNKPIKWVVPYPPGGTADIIARIISQPLEDILGQQVFIENKSGAGNNIGTESVIKSPADGYTMLFVNPANGINASLYKNLPFDFIRDISPVVGIVRTPNVLVVPINFPANDLNEFINYCKNNSDKINMASSGVGTSVHLAGELFKSMTGCNMTHVPYRGAAPALADLLAGHVHVMFDNLPSSSAHIKSGKLKVLAVTSSSREPSLSSVPSIRELVPGYEVTAWYGIGMPKDTPRDIINKMNQAVNKVMQDPKVKERLK